MNDFNDNNEINEKKAADTQPDVRINVPEKNDYSQYSYNYDAAAPAAYKKPMPVWVIPTIVTAAIVAAAAAVCMLLPSVRNSLKLAFSSPESYYAEAERKAASDLSDSIYSAFVSAKETANNNRSKNISEKTTIKFTFGDSVMDETDEYRDILKNVSVSGDLRVRGARSYISLDLLLNDTDIISADVFADTEANKGYLSFPELSDKYYKSDLSLDQNETDSGKTFISLLDSDSITQEKLNAIAQRYTDLYLDFVSSRIVMDKKSTCSVGNVSCPAVKVTVTLTESEYLDLIRKVTDALKTDEDIISVIEDMGSRREDYISEIDRFVSDMNLTASDGNAFDITIYIGTDGKIIGRTLTGKDSVISFVNVSDNDSFASESKIIFNDETGMELMIKGSVSETTVNGTADLTMHSTDDDGKPKSYSARLQFEDVKYKLFENKVFGGKFTLTSPDAKDYELVMTADGDENASTFSADINYEGEMFISVLAENSRYESDEDIVLPSDDKCTDDPTEVIGDDAYDTLIANIGKAAGLSEDELTDAFYSILLGDDHDDYSYDDEYDDNYDDYYDDDYSDYDYDENDFADYDPGVSTYEYRSVDLTGISFTVNGEDIELPCKGLSLPDRIVRTSSALEPHSGSYFFNDDHTIMIYIENEKNSALSADVSKCKSIRVSDGGESRMDFRINGIGIGSSADSIIPALGEPSDSMTYSDGSADYIYCDYESDLFIIISAYDNKIISVSAAKSYLY